MSKELFMNQDMKETDMTDVEEALYLEEIDIADFEYLTGLNEDISTLEKSDKRTCSPHQKKIKDQSHFKKLKNINADRVVDKGDFLKGKYYAPDFRKFQKKMSHKSTRQHADTSNHGCLYRKYFQVGFLES